MISKRSRNFKKLCLALLLCLLLLSCASGAPQQTGQTATVAPPPTRPSGPGCAPLSQTIAGFPPQLAVDCDYIYSELVQIATKYQFRESGQGSRKPGHDGFANAWVQEMLKQLAGFGPAVVKDNFPIQGYEGHPAIAPATNVEITVAGATHSEQIILIGCHYDGFANSTQSAYDDASGCMIILGLAKALGTYWRATHTAPARTLKFVLFDAEEMGILGSFQYVNQTIAGDRSQIVAMFDEEQNGVAYPARAFGQANQPLLPFITLTSPVNPTDLYPTLQDGAHQAQFQAWQTFVTQAIGNAFSIMHALHPSMTYLPNNTQPVFTQADLADSQTIQIADDALGGSDEVPFTLAGIDCITMSGNFSYYDGPGAPSWSYPFDQPEDTVALMNQYTGGSGAKSEGTVLSLALPAVVTLWMLIQPDVMGVAPAPTAPVGTISDLPDSIQPGAALTLSAPGAYAPSGGALSYRWDFGDGASGSGPQVQHAWASAGSYTLKLTITDSAGHSTVIQKTIAVGQNWPQFHNRFDDYPPSDGSEPSNPSLNVPTPGPGNP